MNDNSKDILFDTTKDKEYYQAYFRELNRTATPFFIFIAMMLIGFGVFTIIDKGIEYKDPLPLLITFTGVFYFTFPRLYFYANMRATNNYKIGVIITNDAIQIFEIDRLLRTSTNDFLFDELDSVIIDNKPIEKNTRIHFVEKPYKPRLKKLRNSSYENYLKKQLYKKSYSADYFKDYHVLFDILKQKNIRIHLLRDKNIYIVFK